MNLERKNQRMNISPTPHGHTYLFAPGRWGGKGKLSIIGGPTEAIDLQMIISHSGTGTITAHLEVGFDKGQREGGVELVYTIDLDESETSCNTTAILVNSAVRAILPPTRYC